MRSRYIYISIFILLALTLVAPAQLKSSLGTVPFDFADLQYKIYGVNPGAIVNRRNGVDDLSVFDKGAPSNLYSYVRVTATVPAYDQNGQMLFWFPVGDLPESGFMQNETGKLAREHAMGYPMYLFPDPKQPGFTTYSGLRHAPVIDLTRDMMAGPRAMPLGIRKVYVVYYSEKAYNTKDGWFMMQFMGKKNGWGSDDTPILKTMDDIRYLEKLEYISIKPISVSDMFGPSDFAIARIFYDPTGGSIYPDAKLLMTLKDGMNLPAEDMFVQHFGCLLKTGDYCKLTESLNF